MRRFVGSSLVLCLGAAIVLACFGTPTAATQDPAEKPNFGEVKLISGFLPDPYTKQVIAGGNMILNMTGNNGKGNVRMKITRPPDFKLYYTKGNFQQLSFYVRSNADTTLLIHLPVGGYLVDDDSGGNLNPLITVKDPPSGRYDIWVGTFSDTPNAPAVLHITELNVNTPIPKLN
jgi:hypothetical protein